MFFFPVRSLELLHPQYPAVCCCDCLDWAGLSHNAILANQEGDPVGLESFVNGGGSADAEELTMPLCSNPFCKWFWSGFWVPKHFPTVYLEQ